MKPSEPKPNVTVPPPDWHRQAVGGLWDSIGQLQFEYLHSQGLEPGHYLLDVGCGSLRGGVHFIRYLEKGHYFGIDQSQKLLEAGREIELPRYGLTDREPRLEEMDDFAFGALNHKFDFAMAQSVFTHLTLNSIIRCLVNIDAVLVPGGRFYATFLESHLGKFELEPLDHPCADGSHIKSYLDRNPYHYDLETFAWICQRTQLSLQYIGDWNHPRDQKMLLFLKK